MIKLTREDFSVDEVLVSLRKKNVGGIVFFIGTVRGESGVGDVARMEIEVYPEMVMSQLQTIRQEAITHFGVEDIYIIHRYGDLKIMDNIVLVAVSATHRIEALEACHYVIDELKKRVPIWKREHTKNGAHWLEGERPE